MILSPVPPGLILESLLAVRDEYGGRLGHGRLGPWPTPGELLNPWAPRQLVTQTAVSAPAGSDIGAIEHIVFLMMENRSYDHFFGAYPQGRGFDDHPANSLGARPD
jgi:hypothetical protein